METKPNCYKCKYRGQLWGDAHSYCANKSVKVQGDEYGIKSGWFFWPINFDPTWLVSCTGFKNKEEDRK